MMSRSFRGWFLSDEEEEYDIQDVLSPKKKAQTVVSPIDRISHTRKRKRRSSFTLTPLLKQCSLDVGDEFSIEDVEEDDLDSLTTIDQPGSLNVHHGFTGAEKAVPGRPTLYEMVAYNLHNTRTLHKQLAQFISSIDLDVVIFYIWKSFEDGPWQALIKDADNFFSVIESTAGTCSSVTVGQRFRFEGLVVLQRVTPSISSHLFAVLDTTGYHQREYYRLCVSKDTNWTEMPSSVIAILFEPSEGDFPSDFKQKLDKLQFSTIRNGFVPK